MKEKLIALILLICSVVALPALAQLSTPSQYPEKHNTPSWFKEVAVGQVGTGGQKMVFGGTLWRMQANTGNVTGSATLVGITVPARTFNPINGTGRALKIHVQGQTAANGNTKTLNVLWGSTSVAILNAAANNKTICADVVVRRTGTNTQQVSVSGYANSAVLDTGSTTSAMSESGTNVLQVQMPAATGANDIILNDVTITGESG